VRAVLRHVEALEGWNWAQLSLGPTRDGCWRNGLGPGPRTIGTPKTRPVS